MPESGVGTNDGRKQYCGGINWDADRHYDPWRCPSYMTTCEDGLPPMEHQCAASYDHLDHGRGSDHVCAEGHRWHQPRVRRTWRSRRQGWWWALTGRGTPG